MNNSGLANERKIEYISTDAGRLVDLVIDAYENSFLLTLFFFFW
jgi:hypothetical protein